MWYALDGGDPAHTPGVMGEMPCQWTQNLTSLYGYDLTQISGALAEGSHALEVWWIDKGGNESNHETFNYSVEDAPYKMGTTMEAWTLVDQDGNNVSLSDFDGDIVVIEGFTGWCTYCQQEANENATLQTQYTADGKPVQIVGFMGQTVGGTNNVQQSDLQAWVAAHGWAAAGIPALNDGGFAVLGDYYLMANGGVPFNMVLDQDHVIQVKWAGFGSGIVAEVVSQLLAD